MLLVFCYLVVPPATALLGSRSLITILLFSAAAAVLATLIGLILSYKEDLPGNQTIIMVSCILFAGTWASCNLVNRLKIKPEIVNEKYLSKASGGIVLRFTVRLS